MSAIDRPEATCELELRLAIRTTWVRTFAASVRERCSTVSAWRAAICCSAIAIEGLDGRGDVAHVVVAEGQVQRQHQAALEEALGARQRRLQAERLVLVHRLAAPLDQRADAALLQVLAELVAPLGFDLVVLEDVEM